MTFGLRAADYEDPNTCCAAEGGAPLLRTVVVFTAAPIKTPGVLQTVCVCVCGVSPVLQLL